MKMCFNWKVVTGLAAVGVGLWAVAPSLVGAALPLLIFAACPLSMLFMMKGMGGKAGGACETRPEARQMTAAGERTREERVAALEAELAGVQARQETIARELTRLEDEDAPVVREAESVARAAGGRGPTRR